MNFRQLRQENTVKHRWKRELPYASRLKGSNFPFNEYNVRLSRRFAEKKFYRSHSLIAFAKKWYKSNGNVFFTIMHASRLFFVRCAIKFSFLHFSIQFIFPYLSFSTTEFQRFLRGKGWDDEKILQCRVLCSSFYHEHFTKIKDCKMQIFWESWCLVREQKFVFYLM